MSATPTDPSFLPSQPSANSVLITDMRDRAVIDIWKGLAPNLTDPEDMKMFMELQSPHNQYATALSVFAAAGITRPADQPEQSAEDKLMAIEMAKTMVLAGAPEPEPDLDPEPEVDPIVEQSMNRTYCPG